MKENKNSSEPMSFDMAWKIFSQRSVVMNTSLSSYRISSKSWSFHGQASRMIRGSAPRMDVAVKACFTLKSPRHDVLETVATVFLPNKEARKYYADIPLTDNPAADRLALHKTLESFADSYLQTLFRQLD